MSFLDLFRPKPSSPLPHVTVRYVAATRRENDEAAARRAQVVAQLVAFTAMADAVERAAARTRASIGEGRGQ